MIIDNKSRQDISYLIDNTELWFIPIVNPTGHAASTRTNSMGVDLNRDFPDSWKSATRHQQPEILALLDFFEEHENITTGLDCHTSWPMYMYAYAHTYTAQENSI